MINIIIQKNISIEYILVKLKLRQIKIYLNLSTF